MKPATVMASMRLAPLTGCASASPVREKGEALDAPVGGVPKYWEFVKPKASGLDLADELFFGFARYLDQEPPHSSQ